MKAMKKLSAVLLAAIMLLSLSITAFAATGTNDNNGKITIDNAVAGQTYSIYQIFKLESYNTDPDNNANTNDGIYTYTIDSSSDWYNFVNTGGNGADYVTLEQFGNTTTYYVTWNSNKSSASDTAAFATAALAYAKQNNIAASGTAVALTTGDDGYDSTKNSQNASVSKNTPSGDEEPEYTIQFSSLNLGYYLMDTTLGTLLTLDTTNPEVTVKEKNTIPPIEKKVQEDSTGEWGEENDAQIGDTINYRITVTANPGAEGYVLHDVLSDGLTLNTNSFKVYTGSVAQGNEVASTNYTVNTSGLTDGCTFHVVFNQTYLDSITTETGLIVTYSATLNEKAVIKGDGQNDANTNKTRLEYGNDSFTEWDETKTYTLKFDIVKTDTSNKLLTGAKFELYDARTGGNKINLVAVDSDNDGTVDYYRVATSTETSASGFTSAVIKAGRATVVGLDGGTSYWLEETAAPNGYNKLDERQEVKLESANLVTTMTGDTWSEGNGGVHVTNQSGAELPSTGGMGTTIFYILGAVLVVGAGVLLIVRRRMRTEK